METGGRGESRIFRINKFQPDGLKYVKENAPPFTLLWKGFKLCHLCSSYTSNKTGQGIVQNKIYNL